MAARTTNLLLADLATGESGVLGYANWGEAADDNFARIEDALTETSSIALVATNVTLSDEQERSVYLKLTGTLTANVEVRTNDRKGFWFVHNGTAGAFTVTFKPTSGSGIVIPQGARLVLACDGTDIFQIANLAAVNEDIVPDADSSRDLGTSTKQWAEVHADAGHLDNLHLAEGSAPSTAANQVALYAKESGGVATPFIRRESSGVEVPVLGAWELVETRTPGQVSSLDFTGLSAYRILRITGFIQTSVDGAKVSLRTSTDNGSTFDSGATDYDYQINIASATGTANSRSQDSGYIISTATVGADTGEGLSVVVKLFEFNTSQYMYGVTELTYVNSAGNIFSGTIGGRRLQATARDAFRLVADSGTLGGGMIALEGIRG